MVWPIPSHLSFTPLHGFHSTLAVGAAKKQSSRYVATPTDQTSTLAPGEKGSGWVEDRSMAAPTVASLTSRPIHTCRLWHEPSVSLGCLMTLSLFYLFHAPKLWNILEKRWNVGGMRYVLRNPHVNLESILYTHPTWLSRHRESDTYVANCPLENQTAWTNACKPRYRIKTHDPPELPTEKV